jgi:uncharacterized heparinase superfamily protein
LLRRATARVQVQPAQAAPRPEPARWEDQWPETNASAWIAARRDKGRLYADIAGDALDRLKTNAQDQAVHVIAAAHRILAHEFDLLGSGRFVPVDPGRSSRAGYQPIDWYLDPIANLRFPERVPYREWNLLEMRPGLADIKLPWELGRCQHWVPLGQAYRLTGDDRFAAEIVRQLDDFAEANPVALGIQWTCTMDVALRALNWAIAAELIRESRAFDAAAMQRFYRALFDCAAFVETNLENKYEVTSNHFLSNVVGLYGAAIVFCDLPAGRRWIAACRQWLEQEMRVQVLPDGADYESSVPYHRLVAELFLCGWRLALLDERPLSNDFRSSLVRMIDFLHAVSRPDGLMPQIGDADDGRVHIMSDYGRTTPQDPRHLFGPAAALLNEGRWLSGVDAALARWEAGWWGCGALPAVSPVEPPKLARYEQAGIFVARTGAAFLVVSNGRVGTNGFGNHKHNDLLSFEFHDAGQPLIVDPGSYVYTSNPAARNAFRSTRAHNTLQIDGVEQNDLKPEFLFRLFETSTVEHLRFGESPDGIAYVGRHTGYARLAQPVVHQRTLRMPAACGVALEILDRLEGSGSHTLAWHFHLSPGVEVTSAGSAAFVLASERGRWRLNVGADLSRSIVEAWYSPSYGVRLPCRAIELWTQQDVSATPEFRFTIEREPRG